jgi:hypothetical protein
MRLQSIRAIPRRVRRRASRWLSRTPRVASPSPHEKPGPHPDRDPDRRIICIACFPKSGSTFIANKLANLPGFSRGGAVPAFQRREHELEAESIRRAQERRPGKHLVLKHHVRCSHSTVRIGREFGIEYVVLVRDIMDCLVSMVDHLQNESRFAPMAYWDDDLLRDLEAAGAPSRLEAITRTFAPWYVNFFVSWQRSPLEFPRVNAEWITYEGFFQDPAAGLDDLCTRLAIPCSADDRRRALEIETESRFNQGVTGRGAAAYGEDQRAYAALTSLLACYPTVDFSPIFAPL